MNTNITFLNIVAEYCNTPADEITNDMRFIEDLGFSSLDFMTFLGDLEDTFDVEIDEDECRWDLKGPRSGPAQWQS